MVEGPVFIILDMIVFLVGSTVETLFGLLRLLGNLISSLVFVSAVGGDLGLIIAAAIFVLVGLLVSKFLFGSVKKIIMLVCAGMLILSIILWAAANAV